MNLQLEYYLRNKIQEPFILHGPARLLLCNLKEDYIEDRYKWFVVDTENYEGDDGIHVGRFNLMTYLPSKVETPFKIHKEKVAYWSSYAETIKSQAERWRKKWRAVDDYNDLTIAAWEILAFTADFKFATLPIKMLDVNDKILQKETSKELKLELIKSLVDQISADAYMNYNNNYIIDKWYDIKGILTCGGYSYWLSELVNR